MAKPELLDRRYDVVIAGGGIVGLTLALALKKALGDAISICLCDARVTADGTDQRASAIAPDGVSFFRRIGVWDAIADKTQPILAMKVIDAFKSDTFRPAMLTFGSKSPDSGPLAHMTFHADLERELFAACAANGVASYPQNVRDYAVSGDWAQASLDTGEMLRCALIVAADGARSKLRSQARITTIGRPYGQTAVIVTIEHAKDHEAVAFENFLPSGVLATLPLPGRRSSIVWVERSEAARRLVLASPDVFLVALQEAVGPRLGLISLVGAPRAFALNLQLVRSFVGERIALIGDAAHVIHPLAGQGLNLGLRDVMALTEAIVRQRRLGLDPADAKSLRAYERRRRPDALMMAGLTDGLDRIFSSTSNLVRGARGLGLSTIDRQPSLKNMLVAAAAAQRAQGSDREPSVVSRYE